MLKRTSTKSHVFFIGLFLACSLPLHAQQFPLWGSLKSGPYEVGFRSSTVFDSSRTLPDGRQIRPVQISHWYPAQSPKGPKLRYRDYFLLSATERTSEPLSHGNSEEAVASYRKLLGENGVEGDAMDAWFATPCAATRNAPPANGTFPVVLVAQGMFHSAHHQAVLSEFIASYGFVVLTTPSQTRISGPMSSDDDVVPHAEVQATDLLFALESVSRNPQADARNIGLVGHSFGARSAFLLALRDSRVRGLVSLDGGIANKNGKEWIGRISDFYPTNFKVSILHFYQDADSIVVPDFELLESLKGASRTLVRMPGMRHFYFSSIGMVTAVIPGFGPTREGVLKKQWEAMANYTTDFLLARLKGDRQALMRIQALAAAGKSDRNISAKKLPAERAN